MSKLKQRSRKKKAVKGTGQLTHKGRTSRITQPLSSAALKARKAWDDSFQVSKVNNCQAKLLYTAKVSFKSDDGKKIMAAYIFNLTLGNQRLVAL